MNSVAAKPHPVHKDYQGAKLGMWIFLLTEIVLFGGLFILYSVYRAQYPHDFHAAGRHLNWIIGVANTVILLTSSLTVALAISATQQGNRKMSLLCLSATIALGLFFLVNKYFEWSTEIRNGIYPDGPGLADLPQGEKIFYGLYYAMTGLHGIHVAAGIAVLATMLGFVLRNRIAGTDSIRLENAGLYWHLVDVIWIFLLPMLYLAA